MNCKVCGKNLLEHTLSMLQFCKLSDELKEE